MLRLAVETVRIWFYDRGYRTFCFPCDRVVWSRHRRRCPGGRANRSVARVLSSALRESSLGTDDRPCDPDRVRGV